MTLHISLDDIIDPPTFLDKIRLASYNFTLSRNRIVVLSSDLIEKGRVEGYLLGLKDAAQFLNLSDDQIRKAESDGQKEAIDTLNTGYS